MLRNLNQARAAGRICGTPHSGVLAAAIPTTGDYPALGLNDIDPGDPSGCEYAVEILSLSAGTMDVGENTAFTYTPPAVDYVGTVTGTQRVRKNGVAVYDETFSFSYAAAAGASTVSSDLIAAYSIAALVSADLSAAYGVSGTPIPATSVTITLESRAGVLAINQSGIRVAFFDQSTVDTLAAPVARWANESFDAAGVLTLDITGVTTLMAGGTGWLVASNAANTITHTGPVTVA